MAYESFYAVDIKAKVALEFLLDAVAKKDEWLVMAYLRDGSPMRESILKTKESLDAAELRTQRVESDSTVKAASEVAA